MRLRANLCDRQFDSIRKLHSNLLPAFGIKHHRIKHQDTLAVRLHSSSKRSLIALLIRCKVANYLRIWAAPRKLSANGSTLFANGEPRIDVCLAQLPLGETNPLSARSRSSQTKRTVKIGVGLLPYISIASVWQKRRPVVTDLAAYSHRLRIDTTSCRMVELGVLRSSHNAIPRSNYLFGPSWPHVRRTLLVAMEQDGDPYAVMVPTVLVLFVFFEITRFYYGPLTRLAQALFWGEDDSTFNADRSGVLQEGVGEGAPLLGSRLLPRSKRSFRRKTERRSARS